MTIAATRTTARAARRPALDTAGFERPGEFLNAVRMAERGRVDPRLVPLAVAGSDENGTYSDPAGGFLVPVVLSPLAQGVASEDPTVTQPVPMASPIVKVPARNDKSHTTTVSGGLLLYRRPETVVVPSSRMNLEQITLRAFELCGLTFATQELVDDSFGSFTALLERSFRDEKAATLLAEKIHGTGVGEYGGVLNSPCLITVPKDDGQAAATITPSNLEAMEGRCWHYHRAVWLAHPDTKPLLKTLARVVGTGGSSLPYLTYAPDGAPLLSGRPIYFVDSCSAVGDVGDIVLGVWSEYLEGIYQPLRWDSSVHVRWMEHEQAFRFMERGDGIAWWRVPMTQKNSTTTVSPFVTLAERA